jgi:ketosteroid isomerase-like protein
VSDAEIELVRRLFEYQHLLRAGTLPDDHPFLELWHPDCVLEELAEMPDAAAYRGRDEIARYFGQIPEVWEEFHYTPGEMISGPDGVVATTDLRARSKAGLDAELRVYQVFRLRDSMIVFATAFADRDKALAAVGLT